MWNHPITKHNFKTSFNIGNFILRRHSFCALEICPLTSLKNRILSLKIPRYWSRDSNSWNPSFYSCGAFLKKRMAVRENHGACFRSGPMGGCSLLQTITTDQDFTLKTFILSHDHVSGDFQRKMVREPHEANGFVMQMLLFLLQSDYWTTAF